MDRKDQMTVLVAEDDYIVGEEVARLLRSCGFTRILHAYDGSEAVETTCRERPGVALLDVRMPGVDGLEAARRIQERCPTPVVMLTAYESRELVEKAAAAGAGAYVIKPARAGDLERAIFIATTRHADLVELRGRNEQLRKALDEIKQLRGILPICSYCKSIRNDEGFWQKVETYIREHSEAEFSHGICPECLRTRYPEIGRPGEGGAPEAD